MNSSNPPRPTGSTRVPHSFFYDRVVPAMFVALGLILVVVIVLVIGALTGAIPVK